MDLANGGWNTAGEQVEKVIRAPRAKFQLDSEERHFVSLD